MVTRLDRLARSTRDLLNTLAAITNGMTNVQSFLLQWGVCRSFANSLSPLGTKRLCQPALAGYFCSPAGQARYLVRISENASKVSFGLFSSFILTPDRFRSDQIRIVCTWCMVPRS
jgi:hypothetical protein